MLVLYQKAILTVIIFSLCIVTAVMQRQGELPVEISPVTIPGTIGECPSDDNRQASRNLLRNATREVINQMYGSPLPECGPGNWRRVFYLQLNASRSDLLCPGQWDLMTTPVRGCAGAGESCRSAFSDGSNTAYSKVCGRLIGEGVNTPDAFLRVPPGTIEGNYLDGVSVTHGASGSRTHIWSFGTGHPAGGGLVARCPCDNSNRGEAPFPPAEVGDNYFCDRPNIANVLDRLWTGESCTNDNPCCSFNNPPYFRVQLPAVTTDSIELRICSDQSQSDETVLVLFAEIYVQ